MEKKRLKRTGEAVQTLSSQNRRYFRQREGNRDTALEVGKKPGSLRMREEREVSEVEGRSQKSSTCGGLSRASYLYNNCSSLIRKKAARRPTLRKVLN